MSTNTSFIRKDRSSKINALAHKFAIDLAVQAKDPLYKKYHGAKSKHMQFKAMLFEKYRVKAMDKAKKAFHPK